MIWVRVCPYKILGKQLIHSREEEDDTNWLCVTWNSQATAHTHTHPTTHPPTQPYTCAHKIRVTTGRCSHYVYYVILAPIAYIHLLIKWVTHTHTYSHILTHTRTHTPAPYTVEDSLYRKYRSIQRELYASIKLNDGSIAYVDWISIISLSCPTTTSTFTIRCANSQFNHRGYANSP